MRDEWVSGGDSGSGRLYIGAKDAAQARDLARRASLELPVLEAAETAGAVPGWSDGNLAHICADRLHGRSMSRIDERPSRIAVRSRIVHGQVRNTADRRHLVLHNDRRRSFALCHSAASAPPASTAIDCASRAESRFGATKRTPTSSARSLASRR